MKKTVKISIARFSFSIEETAYLLLEDYINKLKENLSNKKSYITVNF